MEKERARNHIKTIFFCLLIFFILIPLAFAHVGYVLEGHDFDEKKGSDADFLMSALQEPLHIFLIVITLVVVLLLAWGLPKIPWFRDECGFIKKQAHEYAHFVPWICRLGLGIALIGAGSSNALITPFLSAEGFLATLQITCGFLLLAGFLTSIAASVSCLIYIYALTQHFYIIGNLDFLGLAFALLVLKDERPGVDDLFGIPFFVSFEKLKTYAPLILRWSIGVAMLFLAIYEKILNPHTAALVVTNYNLLSVVPVSSAMWVLGAGVVEAVIGLALIIGYKPRVVSAIACFVLSLSFFYFGEDVYSHVTLFAILSCVFIYGNDWGIRDEGEKRVKRRRKN